ncbi:MAG: ATP-binding protein [Candidatus Tectimicrobiota bacterium]
MRLTIFWRVILAQCTPIALILAVSVYTLTQLHQLIQISSDILSNSTTCIQLEKRLQRLFLTQMRQAEKYVLFQDKALYDAFRAGQQDFMASLQQLRPLLGSADEQTLLRQVEDVYARYAEGLATAFQPKSPWNQEKHDLGDRLTGYLNDLIRLQEEMSSRKTAATRDHAAMTARGVQWLSVGGLSIVILLAYGHARGLSRPLQTLAQALRRVGRGEFPAALRVRASAEVRDLASSFNWMAGQLAELDRMKSEFVAHVSHELRTPITGLREGTALLLEQVPGPLTPGQHQVLTVMQTHGEQLWHHIASILDLSKMDAGMMEYTYAPGDVLVLLRRATQSLSLLVQKKQLELKVLTPESLPWLMMDSGRMQQVFDNLVSNAAKFTPPQGTITVTARLLPAETPAGQAIEVRIADTGPGIPAVDHAHIFEAFYQSPHHREAQQMGTGLGLAIARRIVEAHEGTISVESQMDAGATFRVVLPVRDSAPLSRSKASQAFQGGTHDMVPDA